MRRPLPAATASPTSRRCGWSSPAAWAHATGGFATGGYAGELAGEKPPVPPLPPPPPLGLGEELLSSMIASETAALLADAAPADAPAPTPTPPPAAPAAEPPAPAGD